MLAIATFCAGWVSKERWDKEALPTTPAMSLAQAKGVLKILAAERAKLSQNIQRVQSRIDAGDADDVSMNVLHSELERAMQARHVISQQIADIRGSSGGFTILAIPLWVIVTVLSMSTLVISFVAGISVGRRTVVRSIQTSD